MNTHELLLGKAGRFLVGLKSKRGAALAEYIVMGSLIGVFSIGMVSVFGDDIRDVFAAAEDNLAGVDATPASELATPGSYNLKGLKGAGISGEEAGRLAAMTAALKTALNDSRAVRIRDSTVIPRDPRDHPLYPGQQLDGYQVQKAGLVSGTIITYLGIMAATGAVTDWMLTRWFNSMLLEENKELKNKIAKLEGRSLPYPVEEQKAKAEEARRKQKARMYAEEQQKEREADVRKRVEKMEEEI